MGEPVRAEGARASAPIRFGTSGWRGILGEEVTFPRLRVLLRSVLDWVREEDAGDRILIGWDGRFASRSMAETAARICLDSGFRPTLASTRTPTPAMTHAMSRGRAAAALVLTASHNHADYHGLKVFDRYGAAIEDAAARRIEAIAAGRMADDGEPASAGQGRTRDFAEAYRASLSKWVEGDAMRGAGLTVVYDAMHGCGAGILDRVLEHAGATVEGHRLAEDPRFGGTAPDPCARSLGDLCRLTRTAGGLRLGLATDGDGDRIAAVDAKGALLSETQTIAILVDHLATTGRIQKGVALTAGTGSLVEQVARRHGLAVERHPIGFKHLSAAIKAGRVDVAGEESGGFALARLGCDKDGILAGCLLARLVATSGRPLDWHVQRLEREFGSSACGRTSLALTPALGGALTALSASTPGRVGRARIVSCDDRFGLRWTLDDGGFVMLRRSGTEPVLRIYAEAADAELLDRRLAQTERLLRAAGKAI